MKRSAKVLVGLTSVTFCALAAVLIVNEKNHCPLEDFLPKGAELVSCKYQGFIDFSTMIEAKGPLGIKKAFTDNILENRPQLQFVATGYAGWHEGATWRE